jgi:hypothetical protein
MFDSESGTTIQRTQPMAGFCFLQRTLHRTPFDYSPRAAHLRASATSALFNAFGVSPSPGTTIQRTRPGGGFLLLVFSLSEGEGRVRGGMQPSLPDAATPYPGYVIVGRVNEAPPDRFFRMAAQTPYSGYGSQPALLV